VPPQLCLHQDELQTGKILRQCFLDKNLYNYFEEILSLSLSLSLSFFVSLSNTHMHTHTHTHTRTTVLRYVIFLYFPKHAYCAADCTHVVYSDPQNIPGAYQHSVCK